MAGSYSGDNGNWSGRLAFCQGQELRKLAETGSVISSSYFLRCVRKMNQENAPPPNQSRLLAGCEPDNVLDNI
jgi:hypothetical protein